MASIARRLMRVLRAPDATHVGALFKVITQGSRLDGETVACCRKALWQRVAEEYLRSYAANNNGNDHRGTFEKAVVSLVEHSYNFLCRGSVLREAEDKEVAGKREPRT